MDSQHRHELEENVLANWLAEKIEVVKPHLPMIGLGIAAAAMASIAWSSWSASANSGEEQAWQSYSVAVDRGQPNPLALEDVTENFKDSSVADWSRITWADRQVLVASYGYLSNRKSSEEAIDKAEETYNELLAGDAIQEIKDRSHYGLARVQELRGDLDAARKQYRNVGGMFKELAENRAEELESERVQDVYAWLANAEVKRRSPLGPGTPGERPSAEPDSLETPGEEESTEETFGDILKGYENKTDGAEEESADTGETESAAAEAADEEQSAE